MKELHDRINRVMHAEAFLRTLEEAGIDLSDFQCCWAEESKGRFENLRKEFQRAIIAGEKELAGGGTVTLAAA